MIARGSKLRADCRRLPFDVHRAARRLAQPALVGSFNRPLGLRDQLPPTIDRRATDCEPDQKAIGMGPTVSNGGHNGTSLRQVPGLACKTGARVRCACSRPRNI